MFTIWIKFEKYWSQLTEITKYGMKPSENKVKAIIKAQEPKNLTELRSFIELINYYERFYWNCILSWIPCIYFLGKAYSGNGVLNKGKHTLQSKTC